MTDWDLLKELVDANNLPNKYSFYMLIKEHDYNKYPLSSEIIIACIPSVIDEIAMHLDVLKIYMEQTKQHVIDNYSPINVFRYEQIKFLINSVENKATKETQ
ncbi:TPA: hypothetical protein ACX6S6_001508 [Photobacterium damselae]